MGGIFVCHVFPLLSELQSSANTRMVGVTGRWIVGSVLWNSECGEAGPLAEL